MSQYSELKQGIEGSPYGKVNLVSQLTFWYLNGLIKLGKQRPLELSDVWELHERDSCANVSQKFEKAWEEELKRHPKNPHIVRALHHCFGKNFYILGIWKFVYDLLQFLGPLAVLGIVNFLQDKSAPIYIGFLYSFALLIGGTIQTISLHTYFRLCHVTVINCKASLSSAIYKKAVRLSNSARQSSTTGEIVNLMGVDVRRFQDIIPYAHILWSAPLQIIISLVLLFSILGWPVIAGVLTMFLVLPINSKLASVQSRYEEKMMSVKDERSRLMNEVLQGMRIIKFFAWERAFLDKIFSVRLREVKALKIAQFLNIFGNFFWVFSPVMVTFATFILFSITSRDISVGEVFAALSIFGVMRFPLSVFPFVITSLIQASVSSRRINAFLQLDELDEFEKIAKPVPEKTKVRDRTPKKGILLDSFVGQNETSSEEEAFADENFSLNGNEEDLNMIAYALGRSSEPNSSNQNGTNNSNPTINVVNAPLEDFAVRIINGNFKWGVPPKTDKESESDKSKGKEKGKQKEKETVEESNSNSSSSSESENSGFRLSSINLIIPKGKLVLLVGQVGSGKSSLLSALLGDMKQETGVVEKFGSIAYVAQTPWIINATLQQNILMGSPLVQSLYDNVIQACALTSDISILPAGDMTEIGEKGINLSGGQKQRVSLARALYKQADLYLLDDPLASVDVHVGNHILSQAILGSMKGSTRILVTHQMYPLPYADLIIVMKEGKISTMGSYEKLRNEGIDLGVEIDKSKDESKESGKEQNWHIDEKKEKDKKDDNAGKIVTQEERNIGSVKLSAYKEYLKRVGWLAVVAIVTCGALSYSMRVASDWWLSKWTIEYKQVPQPHSLMYYLGIFSFFGINIGVFLCLESIITAPASLKSSTWFHDTTLKRVFGSPLSFFDSTPVGRIMNRFSKDQDKLDFGLPSTMFEFLNCLLPVIVVLSLIVISSPLFIIAVIPLGALYFYVQQYFINTSRELQRLDNISSSPIFSHFTETLQGITTIRAFSLTNNYIDILNAKIDQNNAVFYLNILVNRWLGQRLEFLSTLVIVSTAFFATVSRQWNNPTLIGLGLSWALSLTGTLTWLVRMTSDTESKMNSVERMLNYIALPQEGDNSDNPSSLSIVRVSPPANFPLTGKIELRNVWMRYRPDLPPVLKGLNVVIPPNTKLGIVGRTGSGKSSLMLALFNLVDIYQGSILIDNIDIKTLTFEGLRSSLSIIPQDPILFSGTVRYNLDPFNQHTENELWAVLNRSGIENTIQNNPLGLDSPVSEEGSNFSAGERQLLCLARALLRRTKIIVLDEATSSVDFTTDAFIQKTLRQECADCVIIAIAHRLNTILDYDMVLVMDQGKIVEIGNPQELSVKPDTIFGEMLKNSK